MTGTPNSPPEYLYRFYDFKWAETEYDDYGRTYSPLYANIKLNLLVLPIIKRTPCGAWVGEYGDRKFVNLKARKKWACETEEEALESYVRRKRKQIAIVEEQLFVAREALRIGEAEQKKRREAASGQDHSA